MLRDQIFQIFGSEESAIALCRVGDILAFFGYRAGLFAGQPIRPAILGVRLKVQRLSVGRKAEVFCYRFVVWMNVLELLISL